jgi:hypothetical protein
VIAGSTESSGEHYVYAISMSAVCHNISVGIGNASVHVPTPIDNAIVAHQVAHKGRDTTNLARLFVEQLVQKVAREGGTVTDLPPVSQNASDIDSLLELARFGPLLRHPEYKTSFLAAMLKLRIYHFQSLARIIAPGSGNLWPKPCNYRELQNLRGLFRTLPESDSLDRAVQLMQQIMIELGISPIPSMNHPRPVMRNLCRDYNLSSMRPLQPPLLVPPYTYPHHLPKVLARLLYAANVRKFFVYCGPLEDWLKYQSSGHVTLDIAMLYQDTDVSEWTPRRLGANSRAQWPAFVIPENRRGDYDGQTQARFSRYGDIVEHAELRDLVLRLVNR